MAITVPIEVRLSLIARKALLPVAVAFVEKSSLAFGLEEADALPMTLAAEEIFAYLCLRGAPEQPVSVRCLSGGYFVETEFSFQPQEFDLSAFNLTAAPSLEGEGDIEASSLLIASRMVDRFRFSSDEHGLRVTLTKERAYAEAAGLTTAVSRPLDEFLLRTPDPEELKELVHLVQAYYAGRLLPADFRYPGKVADMAAAQVYRALAAFDHSGHMGGGMLWLFQSPRIVACHGPYVFGQPQESAMAQQLVDGCIAAVAKSQAVGIINRYPTPQLPRGYFEELGSLTYLDAAGSSVEIPTFYRHLQEDHGATVWAHPLLEEFLTREYRRLWFARDIKPVRNEGELHSRHSVISAEFDRQQGAVVLRPVWWGDDAEEILTGHVEILRTDGIRSIFFETDLGKPWQAYFGPALERSGFEPRLILPYCGKGDIVVFQAAGIRRRLGRTVTGSMAGELGTPQTGNE